MVGGWRAQPQWLVAWEVRAGCPRHYLPLGRWPQLRARRGPKGQRDGGGAREVTARLEGPLEGPPAVVVAL